MNFKFLLLFFVVSICGQGNDNSLQIVSRGSEQFAVKLFKTISDALGNTKYDFMISPFSIWSLLVLMTEGSNGNTKQQLEQTLELPPDIRTLRDGFKQIQDLLNVNTPTVSISYSQSIFTNFNTLLSSYSGLLQNTYRSGIKEVDFSNIPQAKKTINDFVRVSTNGLIEYVVNDDDLANAQMVAISSIYFKGQWRSPFNVSQTRSMQFTDEYGTVLGNVPMMFQRAAFPYVVLKSLYSYALELPYGRDNRLSMIILLPSKNTSLDVVFDKLTSSSIEFIQSELTRSAEMFEDEEIETLIPRFKTKTDFVLNGPLQQMGIRDLFDSNNADLSKMTDKSIYLSRIFHQSVIEVNEEGTVASAVTGGVFANKASPIKFEANRPFIYLIVDKLTKSLLFSGQVKDPTKSN